MSDLEDLDVGTVFDIFIESANDRAEDAYNTERMATQADMDRF